MTIGHVAGARSLAHSSIFFVAFVDVINPTFARLVTLRYRLRSRARATVTDVRRNSGVIEHYYERGRDTMITQFSGEKSGGSDVPAA